MRIVVLGRLSDPGAEIFKEQNGVLLVYFGGPKREKQHLVQSDEVQIKAQGVFKKPGNALEVGMRRRRHPVPSSRQMTQGV